MQAFGLEKEPDAIRRCKRRHPICLSYDLAVICAFLPAIVLGAVFHSTIKSLLFNPRTVSFALIVAGIAILIIERNVPPPTISDLSAISWKRALAIGFFLAYRVPPPRS